MIDIPVMHFWPAGRFSVKHFIPLGILCEDIESFFNGIFAPHRVLLFSSARSALKSVLQAHGISRPCLVWVMDYSSHCVFNAVSTVGTPLVGTPVGADLCVVYHQYGNQKVLTIDRPVIEDSVESFFVDGSGCFSPSSSRYEIISLPKVISSCFGGLSVCKDEASFNALKNVREQGQLIPSGLVGMFRALKQSYPPALYLWEGSALYSPKTASFMVNEIHSRLGKWDEMIDRRLTNARVVYDRLGIITDKIRLPSAVMLPIERIKEDIIPLVGHLIRNVYSDEIIGMQNIVNRRLLLPIHHEVDISELNKFLDLTLK